MRITESRLLRLALVGLVLGAFSGSDSESAFLKNGIRPGDRSSMTIIRRPSPGTRRRILRPGERQRAPASRPGRSQRHAWFWKIHSTAATAAGAARWQAALETMAKRRSAGKSIIDAARLGEIAAAYRTEITAAAAATGLSEALIIAVIAVESRGKPRAVSPKGAQGLMQLIPATAKRFGVTDSFDAGQNIGGGAAYLNWLLREFRGDVLLALAGYNAGEGAVRKHKGVPPYAETRDYVVLVLDALSATQKLCGTLKGPRQRCTLKDDTG